MEEKTANFLTRAALIPLAVALFAGCTQLFGGENKLSAEEGRGLPDSRQNSEEWGPQFSGSGYQALQSSAERALYAQIDEVIYETESRTIRTERFDDIRRIGDVIEFYKDDHPGVFWIDETTPYYYSNDSSGLTLELNYKSEGDELKKAKEKLEETVSAALFMAPSGSEYEQELFIHNWIIENCEYDNKAVKMHKEDKVRGNEQNAYGAIVDGLAVCEGYTRAFQLLCERLNIPCRVIQGQAEGFSSDDVTNHIWNCVQLDGEWYQVDVTWDDYDSESATEESRYYYFNLTTKEIKKDHTLSPLYSDYSEPDVWYNSFIPRCDSKTYNYFELNALHVSDPDSASGGEFVAAAAERSAECCSFLIDEDIDFDDMFDEMVKRYAFDWVSQANVLNGHDPEISNKCKLTSNGDRRVVTLILDYV